MSAKPKVSSAILILFVLIISAVFTKNTAAKPQKQWSVTSPDKNLTVVVAQKKLGAPYPSQNNLYYCVKLAGKEVLPYAPLGITATEENGNFVSNLVFISKSNQVINETYPMLTGKKSTHRNFAKEKTLNFKNPQGQIVSIIFRAYNDGFAYRYRIEGKGTKEITGELSGFRVPANSIGWLQDYILDYQGYYPKRTSGDNITSDIGFPALFQTPGGIWLLATEAAVYGDYAAARLTGSLKEPCIFKLKLPDAKISVQMPCETPWRVGIVGKKIGTIVESVLVDNLNPPCELAETGWIKPGRVAFPWLTNHNAHAHPETLRAFVDLAAEMGWEWLEVETAHIGTESWAGLSDAWMKQEWLPELVEYAKSKGVDIYGWENWKSVYTQEQRDWILPAYSKMGIKGVKADFVKSDSQDAMKWYDEFTKDCAKHKLMVSFHGATLPRGQQRRWPNILTWEAVLGEEWHTLPEAKNPCPPPTPELNCQLPFTRNVVGPMDYTPVVFSMPTKTTTDAHELALSVIFESAWQCIADSPASYAASPGKPFLKEVPVTWDDIHFIDGYPGKFTCLARRKGNDWFVAAINAGTARTLKIPLKFLKKGNYSITVYKDDAQAKNIAVENITLDTNKPFEISVPANGGFCMKVANSN